MLVQLGSHQPWLILTRRRLPGLGSPLVPEACGVRFKTAIERWNLGFLDVEPETGMGFAEMGRTAQTPFFVGWRLVERGGDTGFVSRVCLTRSCVSPRSDGSSVPNATSRPFDRVRQVRSPTN